MRVTFSAVGMLALLGALACRRPAREEPERGLLPPAAATAASGASEPALSPLRVAYSDWPGWVAWQVAIEKNYFVDAGVDVEFVWLEYVPSIEAFSEGKVDAVCMTNGDALVAGSSGAPSVGVLINDYSNGNDMVVARPGIQTIAELRAKRIAVEIGFVDHLLLMEGLKSAHMVEADVNIINTKTHEAPALLAAGSVDAIAAWQPHSGQALDEVVGSQAVFTSAHAPGLIYDLLFVSRASLAARRGDWLKVVEVWFRVVDFIADAQHRAEAVQIMARRVGLLPDKYAKLLSGTRLLGRKENQQRFQRVDGFGSVEGSSEAVDRFNVANRVYKDPVVVAPYFDSTLVNHHFGP